MRARAPALDTASSRAPGASPTASALPVALLLFLFAGQAVRNTVGWPGFLAASLVLVALAARLLWRHRALLRWAALPRGILVFLAVCTASLAWSAYPGATLLGLLAQWATALAGFALALTMSWPALLTALGRALTAILALSLAFELFVAIGLGTRLAPLPLPQRGDLPGPYYWSENRLFELGPIQGIVGNRNLLGFVALLSLILSGLKLAGDRALRTSSLLALSLAGSTLLLTRSATVVLAGAAVAAVVVLVATLRRWSPARRSRRGGLTAAGAVAVASVALQHPHALLALLGRADSSGRGTIWRIVADLAEQRPILGWGWVSYWAPWVSPYDGLVVFDGVEYLQAHNALLDVWLQLGIPGVLAAVALATTALLAGGRRAVRGEGWADPAPLLLLVALLAQSLTESRLLVEGNWALLVAICTTLASGSEPSRSAGPPSAALPARPGRRSAPSSS